MLCSSLILIWYHSKQHFKLSDIVITRDYCIFIIFFKLPSFQIYYKKSMSFVKVFEGDPGKETYFPDITKNFIPNISGTKQKCCSHGLSQICCCPFMFFFLSPQINKKPIVFVEVFEGYLETYLPGSPKNFIPKIGSTKYKAVCSLENEYCLFPANTQTAVCSKIAAMMVNLRIL